MATAIIPLIPSIISGAPAVINTLVSVIGGLVHKHEKATVVTQPAGATAPVVSPAPGESKKAAAMNDFVLIAVPIVALLIKMETGREIDQAALASAASGLIDNIVALNNALGIFQTSAQTTPK